MEATADTVIQAGDVVAVAGRRDVLVSLIGAEAEEVDDRELLAVPVEGVDVYVTNKEVDGQDAGGTGDNAAGARRVPAEDHPRRDRDRHSDPAEHAVHRGDIVTLVGRTPGHRGGDQDAGLSRPATDVADVAFIGAAIAIGALVGALVYKIGSVPLTLSTSGGALICRPVLRLAALGAPDLRRIPSSDRLVHELGRPEHFHRGRRHLVRAGLRGRPADSTASACSCGASSPRPCR